MNTRRRFLSLLLPAIALSAAPAMAAERRYRLTLIFSELDFKWSRVIEYRDDFHLFLNANPFPTVKGGIYVAGIVYPKKGVDYVSVVIGTTLSNGPVSYKEIGPSLGEIKFLKLPKDGRFQIPPIGGHYKSCQARVEFLP